MHNAQNKMFLQNFQKRAILKLYMAKRCDYKYFQIRRVVVVLFSVHVISVCLYLHGDDFDDEYMEISYFYDETFENKILILQ